MKSKILLSTLMISGALCARAQTPWTLSGNGNASTSSKLGTTNAIPLNLTTNNVSRLFIGTDGRFGFGTTSPANQFHVEGNGLNLFVNPAAVSSTSGSGLVGYVRGTPTASGQRLGYFLTGSLNGGTDPGNGTGMVGYAEGAWSTQSRPAYLTFETTASGSRDRQERMRINNIGYVGIGTSDPSHRLEVVEGNSFETAIYADGGYNGLSAIGGSYGLIAGTHNGAGIGVQGTGQTGVYGSGTLAGVFGGNSSTATSGSGYYGVHGVSVTAKYGYGVYGEGTSVGVFGLANSGGIGLDAQAYGTGAIGAYIYSGSGTGLQASGGSGYYAGYFSGPVYTTSTYQTSDKKLKKNIAEFTDAISILNKLKPRTYEFLTDGKMAEMNLPTGKHYGLIAQDLEAVLPNLVKETEENPKPNDGSKIGSDSKDKQTFKAVNYTELIPILIKGMQEQDAEKEALTQRVQTLEATVEQLKAMLLSNNTSGSLSSVSLDVASPNPAKSNTTIHYNIPAGTASAKLIVVNISGQVLREFSLAGGAGQVNLNVSNLAAGSYPCTLWMNGQPTVSKQLVVVR